VVFQAGLVVIMALPARPMYRKEMPQVPHKALPPSMHPKAVGVRLKLLREAANLTAAALCRALGINRGSYSLFEQGKRAVPEHVKVQLADFYGTTLDYLILGRATDDELNVVIARLISLNQNVSAKKAARG
jgi:DNA-binding XRE family transcriptional regulator